MAADSLVKVLGLTPHPYHRTGYFREVYRSILNVKPLSDERSSRNAGTCIQLLMKGDDVDPWHKIKSDETFFYHKGSFLKLYTIDSHGNLECKVIGDASQDPGAAYSVVVQAGTWFAGELVEQEKDSFGLFSVFVCPGFDFSDSQIGEPDELSGLFPQHKEIIQRLCLRKACE